jgi:competence protein ComFC
VIQRHFKRVFQSIGSLLSPTKQQCVYCKQTAHLDEECMGLCNSCYNSIPWIKEVLCLTCGRYETCFDCKRRGSSYFENNRSAVRYDDAMKELLARYKYRGDERLKAVMGEMLVHAMRLTRAGLAPKPFMEVTDVITYVPVSEQRFMERGFNQAEQMAIELSRKLRIPVASLLKRARHTDKQSFKKRSDRLDDLHNVFMVDDGGIRGYFTGEKGYVRIFLVDDVYTTGSTINQCAKVLKERLDADIYGITWAR